MPLSVEPSRGRVTPRLDFASQLKRGTQVALRAVGAAAELVPGGVFVSAVAEAAAQGLEVAGAGGSGPAAGGDERWALLEAQERLQREGMANSLRLLGLQRRMQQETEQVSTLSNVMKTRHEMAKAAIQNLRG
jgi:hypothetical protein